MSAAAAIVDAMLARHEALAVEEALGWTVVQQDTSTGALTVTGFWPSPVEACAEATRLWEQRDPDAGDELLVQVHAVQPA